MGMQTHAHVCEIKNRGPLQTKDDDLLGSCQAICRAVPSANICAHYSLKYNYHTNAERTYEAFRDFCTDMAALDGRAAVMLISGGGKKRKLDTLRLAGFKAFHLTSNFGYWMGNVQCSQALEMAQKDKRFPKHLPLYVCFNPYFPDDADLAAERHRLKQKLEQGTGLITGIYLQRHLAVVTREPVLSSGVERHILSGRVMPLLQTGTDLKRLEDGLRLLWEVVGQRVQGDGLGDMELLGSVFLPTKRQASDAG
ncbi:MAG: hypothetical protein MMC33_004252 [Icmadophila ericetorum]|nr:hypothetical protein [Icmadophila ericetorum]